jgi:hypothetical protein
VFGLTSGTGFYLIGHFHIVKSVFPPSLSQQSFWLPSFEKCLILQRAGDMTAFLTNTQDASVIPSQVALPLSACTYLLLVLVVDMSCHPLVSALQFMAQDCHYS